ncbi:hypothetical protein [Enterobacter soli]|uniref:hypothetical protein n=1 Tax=Enterobacter soli TaxID=885040 RepID=UPI0034CF34A7
MATIPGLSYPQSEESFIQHLLAMPVSASADRVELSDACTAYVSVLVETPDAETRAALCQRLNDTLAALRSRCDTALAPHLIERLVEGEKVRSCVPACWQEASLQVDYALALTQAIQGGTLPAGVENDLTGLLHDMVWLLAEFVKEPMLATH